MLRVNVRCSYTLEVEEDEVSLAREKHKPKNTKLSRPNKLFSLSLSLSLCLSVPWIRPSTPR